MLLALKDAMLLASFWKLDKWWIITASHLQASSLREADSWGQVAGLPAKAFNALELLWGKIGQTPAERARHPLGRVVPVWEQSLPPFSLSRAVNSSLLALQAEHCSGDRLEMSTPRSICANYCLRVDLHAWHPALAPNAASSEGPKTGLQEEPHAEERAHPDLGAGSTEDSELSWQGDAEENKRKQSRTLDCVSSK